MKRQMQALGALWLLCTGMAFGQATNSADVIGTVTDSSGAVIPSVSITIKNLDKGQTRTIVSNGAGLFDSGPLVPNDRYTFTFSRDGFATLQRGPMQLSVGQVGMNVQLSVGQTTQQIVVNESAPLLQTTSAELSATIPTATLQALPQTGNPDWQSFLILLPGTSGNGGTASANPGMGSLAANGSMPFSTAMVDGSTVSSPMSDNVINTPIFEALGEVQMSDANFSAQYGTGGIVFNQISKGGSNTWHGMGYDYFENSALNAATYGFGFGKVPVLKRNNFGWQASGPVIKNKIFFMIDWEHRIQHAAGAVSIVTLPTNAMRTGDFTGLPTIYDPTTQVVTGSTVTRQSFISEYGNGNKIPAALIDPVAKKIQAIFPSVSDTTFKTNNFSYAAPAAITTLQKWFGRFDADITHNNRLSGSAAYNYPTTFPSTGIVYPVNVTIVDVENESAQLTDVHTFSSHTINEARSGWMGEYDLLKSATDGKGWPAQLGLLIAKTDIFPTVNINGYYGLGPGTSANYRENVFTESDVLTLIRGRHSLHLGGEFVAYRADSTAWGNKISANLGFTGVYTQGGNTTATAVGGDPYADFLLGYTQNWSALVSPVYYGRLKNPAVFVQDDFKVTPKLTLNLGLRWEGRTGWIDSTKNQRAFDPTVTNPATNTLGAMWYALTAANGRDRLQSNKFNNWLPRVGVAYQLTSRTQLNGGFGMYTFPWNVDSYASCCMGNARSSSGSAADSTGNINPVVILSSDGNTNYQGAAGKSINALYVTAPTTPDAYNGQAVSYMQYDQAIPRLYNWNVTVQRQLTGNMMGQLGYVGSHGTNLLYNTDLDQIPVSKLGPNDTTTGCNGGSCRPYPQYQAISGFHPIATSVYHAVQVVFSRRMSNGLTLNANYTWSHMTDSQDSSGWGSQQGTTIWQNAYDPQANWGAANFDVRHMYKAYGTYDLPFGRGRKYLANNAVLDEAIGGWTMSLTYVGQTGHPFTPNMLVNNSYASTNQASGFKWFPNQVGDPKASGSSGTINQWFNPSAFQSPTPGTLGNMRRNNVYGPGSQVINGSIHKTFRIYERVSFELAANATNLINHASFANPDTVIGTGHHAQITATTVGGRAVSLVGHIRF
jgi:hypothetical protein